MSFLGFLVYFWFLLKGPTVALLSKALILDRTLTSSEAFVAEYVFLMVQSKRGVQLLMMQRLYTFLVEGEVGAKRPLEMSDQLSVGEFGYVVALASKTLKLFVLETQLFPTKAFQISMTTAGLPRGKPWYLPVFFL